jgi:stage II sporulation protein AB (anti-sigma F factor)
LLTRQHQHQRARTSSVIDWRADGSIRLRLPAEPESVTTAREELTELARQQGAGSEAIEAVAIAVSEAVGNGIIHGYRDGASGQIAVEAKLDADPEALLITVADEGVGMSPHPESPGLGLGLPLIHRFATSVDVEAPVRGTRLHMRFALGS